MIENLRKIIAILQRDFRILFTYKLAFSTMFLNMIFNFFYFVLFGTMFSQEMPQYLSSYQQDFVTYLLIGSIGWSFLWSVTSSSSVAIRNEMMLGTLETLLLSTTKLSTLIIAYTFFGCFFGLISVFILLFVGYFFFGIYLIFNYLTVLIFIISSIMMAGLGMIFCGITLSKKNIGNAIPVIQNISMFFAGVYFPITVLPKILQEYAKFIPFYYPIEGIRISILDPSKSLFFICIISLFASSFILFGIVSLRIGLDKAKRESSLSFY